MLSIRSLLDRIPNWTADVRSRRSGLTKWATRSLLAAAFGAAAAPALAQQSPAALPYGMRSGAMPTTIQVGGRSYPDERSALQAYYEQSFRTADGRQLYGTYGASPRGRQTVVPTAGFRFRAGIRTRVEQRRGALGASELPATVRLTDDAIARSRNRFLTVGTHTPWQIFHGTLALRDKFLVRHNDRLVPAIDWISGGVRHDNTALVERTPNGARMHPFTVPYAFEGHTNQFLAILSLSGLGREHRFLTPTGDAVTMDDMVRGAQLELNGEGELTWTLWFLSHYVEPDAEWMTATGEPWSMERLVRIEARKTVEDAPCGGTHRLFALALARNSYLAKHGQLRGVWIEADQRVRRYVAATRQMQNSDGTFSEQWYKGRGVSGDLDRRLKTTGHQLEWLMAAVPQDELESDWMQRAVRAVSQDVIRSAETAAECGALYHALDALVLYRTRLANRFPMEPDPKIEQKTEPPLQQALGEPLGKTASIQSETAPVSDSEGEWTAKGEGDAIVEHETGASSPLVAQPQFAGAQPQEVTLPKEIDAEAMPTAPPRVASRPGLDPSLTHTVSQPIGESDVDESDVDESSDTTTAPTTPMQVAPPEKSGPTSESAASPEDQPTSPISTEKRQTADEPTPPGIPKQARRARILEASFRFSNLDAEGRLRAE